MRRPEPVLFLYGRMAHSLFCAKQAQQQVYIHSKQEKNPTTIAVHLYYSREYP
jgi:hypothetical protein